MDGSPDRTRAVGLDTRPAFEIRSKGEAQTAALAAARAKTKENDKKVAAATEKWSKSQAAEKAAKLKMAERHRKTQEAGRKRVISEKRTKHEAAVILDAETRLLASSIFSKR